jgi:hypothetical protein
MKAIFFLLSETCSAFMVGHAAPNFFFSEISKLLERWTKCIAKGTKYAEQDRQCSYKVKLRRFRATIVAVEEQ